MQYFFQTIARYLISQHILYAESLLVLAMTLQTHAEESVAILAGFFFFTLANRATQLHAPPWS